MADPFTWKPEAVIEYLCSSEREITDEHEALADKIRENRINGKRLLTFNILLSDRQLQEHLGLTHAWQQLELADAIHELRQHSDGFRAWETARTVAKSGPIRNSTAPSNGTNGAPSLSSPEAEAKAASLQPTASSSATTPRADGPKSLSSLVSTERIDATSAGPTHENFDHGGSDVHSADASARASKRRRLAPINMSSQPITSAPVPVHGERDFLSARYLRDVDEQSVKQAFSRHAYLGEGSLPFDFLQPSDSAIGKRLTEEEAGGFRLGLPTAYPRGQRLVVHRGMKRIMRRNTRDLDLVAAGVRPPSRQSSLGLDDLPSEYDEQTLREFSAELRELEAERQYNVSDDRVAELLDEAAAQVRADWQEFKLPKYQRKAHKYWTDASRRGVRHQMTLAISKELTHLEERLRKQRAEIIGNTWATSKDVIRQASICDVTIEDICQKRWHLNLLASRHGPPRPHHSRPTNVARKPREEAPIGEEILYSSEEDDDFIVDDSQDVANQLSADVGYASSLPMKDLPETQTREQAVTDLTAIQTPRKMRPVTDVIDLTSSPTAPHHDATLVTSNAEDVNGEAGTERLVDAAMVNEACSKAPKEIKNGPRTLFLLSLLWQLGYNDRKQVLEQVRKGRLRNIWADTVEAYLTRLSALGSDMDQEALDGEIMPEILQTAFYITRIFLMYYKQRVHTDKRLFPNLKAKLKPGLKSPELRTWFAMFIEVLRQAAPHFPDKKQIYRREAILEDDQPSGDEFGDDASAARTPGRKRRAVEVIQDKDAVDLREREKKRNEEIELRRQKLRAQLACSDNVPANKTQHIINEGKEDHQGLIYINQDIGRRIKAHQVDGVRFLWQQIVQDAQVRQGCLLAHTMGLGKTMQVITFLVALHDAVHSNDPTVREQVPQDLRQNTTLIICPAGLVDNWMDELLTWSPPNTLGPFEKIDSTLSSEERISAIEKWAQAGGILIIGYEMLKQVFGASQRIAELLTDTPKTVVADEAHKLKNAQSQINVLCSQFKTGCRIALTGSPLANNVQEYYHMIDWVAPNFLGPQQEFKEIYEKDIQNGLYNDSMGFEKRQAIKMLQVLKETVAPKVHRATIAALKDDLPNKHEFVISLEPTEMQRNLYNACIKDINTSCDADVRANQTFQLINTLSLVCNHPKCLLEKVRATKEHSRDDMGSLSMAIHASVHKATRGVDVDNPNLSAKVRLLIKVLDDAKAADDKVLVFSTSIPTLQYLQAILSMQKRSISLLDGHTSVSKRQINVREFNNGEKQVYLISTKAGGVGLNIQGANRVVLFDFKWNPMDEQQAVGRAYRLGQQKTVYVYRFLLAGTFEEDLHNQAIFKTQLASRVVDKKNPISWSKRGKKLIHEVKPAVRKDLTPFKGKDDLLDNIIEDPSDVVVSIMTTDTFEEEDHTAALTADELKEADKLVQLNRLRTTDPAAYQRELETQRAAAASLVVPHTTQSTSNGAMIPGLTHLRTQPAPTPAITPAPSPTMSHAPTPTANHAPIPSNLSQSMDGTSDFPMIPSKKSSGTFNMLTTRGHTKIAYQPAPNASNNIPAPPPMAGANTYFGSQPSPWPSIRPAPPKVKQTPFEADRMMTRAKDDFRHTFLHVLSRVQRSWPQTTNRDQQTVAQIVDDVDQLRRGRGLGFLPDDLMWRDLQAHLGNERFAAAVLAGQLTPQYLAFVRTKDLHARRDVLDDMSEAQFAGYLEGIGNSTDPTNLDNIRRTDNASPGTRRAVHAHEDLTAMRAAAERRRSSQPPSQLPSWATSALKGRQ